MRRSLMTELGWDPEWEVNPKEIKLLDKIGEWTLQTCNCFLGMGFDLGSGDMHAASQVWTKPITA
jgi:hypothetical protein